jgi:hypothetical protein
MLTNHMYPSWEIFYPTKYGVREWDHKVVVAIPVSLSF